MIKNVIKHILKIIREGLDEIASSKILRFMIILFVIVIATLLYRNNQKITTNSIDNKDFIYSEDVEKIHNMIDSMYSTGSYIDILYTTEFYKEPIRYGHDVYSNDGYCYSEFLNQSGSQLYSNVYSKYNNGNKYEYKNEKLKTKLSSGYSNLGELQMILDYIKTDTNNTVKFNRVQNDVDVFIDSSIQINHKVSIDNTEISNIRACSGKLIEYQIEIKGLKNIQKVYQSNNRDRAFRSPNETYNEYKNAIEYISTNKDDNDPTLIINIKCIDDTGISVVFSINKPELVMKEFNGYTSLGDWNANINHFKNSKYVYNQIIKNLNSIISVNTNKLKSNESKVLESDNEDLDINNKSYIGIVSSLYEKDNLSSIEARLYQLEPPTGYTNSDRDHMIKIYNDTKNWDSNSVGIDGLIDCPLDDLEDLKFIDDYIIACENDYILSSSNKKDTGLVFWKDTLGNLVHLFK